MLSKEQQILWRVLRGEEMDSREFSPPEMFALLRRHKLLPIASRLIPFLPKVNALRWQQQLEAWKARAEGVSDELAHLNRIIRQKTGIQPIHIKGPLLSVELYGNVWERQYSDLDLLVHREHLDELVLLLEADGYETKDSEGLNKQIAFFKYNNDVVFYHSEKKVMLELHVGLYVEQLLNQKDEKLFLENLNYRPFRGEECAVMTAETYFLYLCFHGTKHMYFRLSWLRDIASFILKSDMDCEKVIALAYDLKWQKILYLSLFQVKKYFSIELPEAFGNYIHQKKYRSLLQLCDKIIAGPGELVYENYKGLRQKPNQIKGVNKVSLSMLLYQLSFLVLLRNGLRAKLAFLFYQLKKRRLL